MHFLHSLCVFSIDILRQKRYNERNTAGTYLYPVRYSIEFYSSGFMLKSPPTLVRYRKHSDSAYFLF